MQFVFIYLHLLKTITTRGTSESTTQKYFIIDNRRLTFWRNSSCTDDENRVREFRENHAGIF